jgi:hypothetical protein
MLAGHGMTSVFSSYHLIERCGSAVPVAMAAPTRR